MEATTHDQSTDNPLFTFPVLVGNLHLLATKRLVMIWLQQL